MSGTIRVFGDQLGAGVCRACRARLLWAVTVPGGRRMPLEADTVPVAELSDASGRPVWVVAADRAHWASCSHAAAFRRPRKA